MATPRARGGVSLTTSSLIRTSPDVWRSSPAMILRKVVLPQPDGPSSTRNSPSGTDMLTPSTAGTSPKSFLIFSATTLAIPRLPRYLQHLLAILIVTLRRGRRVRQYEASTFACTNRQALRAEQVHPPNPL